MMEIITDDLSYSALPVYNAELEGETYFIDDNHQLRKVENNRKIFTVPMHVETFERYYKNHKTFKPILQKIKDFFLGESPSVHQIYDRYKEIYDKFYQEVKLQKTISQDIIKLFEDLGCYQLRVVSKDEGVNAFPDNNGINCIWERRVGYFGLKEFKNGC